MIQAELARQLGLAPASITKLKAMGMPVHCAQAAAAWRTDNLHPRAKAAPPDWPGIIAKILGLSRAEVLRRPGGPHDDEGDL
jgi:hypothetical protein